MKRGSACCITAPPTHRWFHIVYGTAIPLLNSFSIHEDDPIHYATIFDVGGTTGSKRLSSVEMMGLDGP